MTAFAYYRLPYLHHAIKVVQHEGKPETFSSVDCLNGKQGFVVAPFAPSAACPVVLIHPDETKLLSVGKEEAAERDVVSFVAEQDKDGYAQTFCRFHEQLEAGAFQKIVLARCARWIRRDKSEGAMNLMDDAEQLFLRACRLYPRLFVSLLYTEQSGMWLMATPEVLLRGEGCEMTTMSLAGTQKAASSKMVADYPIEGVCWSHKNQEEQQYVTDYIKRCVSEFSSDCTLKGPYTTMAANLYHLRTDIHFRLKDGEHLGDVLQALYPTPAVCGIPKEATQRFILCHERQPRKYYSGFVGPLSMQGKTHLFVSLRCMNILPDGSYELYAGGGLLKESEMQKEWEETEAKMQTIYRVLSV